MRYLKERIGNLFKAHVYKFQQACSITCKNTAECFSFQYEKGKCKLGGLMDIDAGDVNGFPAFVHFHGNFSHAS